MNCARAPALILLMIFCPASFSCSWLPDSIEKSVRFREKTTGLHKDNLEALLAAFNKIENNKTTRGFYEKELGFDVFSRRVKNVKIVGGVEAFQDIYGPNVFQQTSIEKLKDPKTTSEFNRFTLVKIPFVRITTEKDRIYFSKQETIRVGDEVWLSTMFYDDVVVYHAPKIEHIDEKETDFAFAQGLIEWLEKIAVGTGSIRKVLEALEK